MPLDSLDFETHLDEQIRLHGAGDFAERQAESMHALVVFNPLRDSAGESIKCAGRLSVQGAQFHLRHGAARRLLMNWRAYRKLIFSVPADRVHPLSYDELEGLERDLNVTYMNLVGILDNYAWALLKEFGRGKAPPSVQVSLFGDRFAKHAGLEGISDVLDPFCGWYRELRAKRDPVAHRIPLTIPPAHLDQAQAEEYAALGDQHAAAVSALDFETAEAIHTAQEKVGRFRPVFMHDPAEPPIPLYPTLPQDSARLLELMSALHEYVERRLARP